MQSINKHDSIEKQDSGWFKIFLLTGLSVIAGIIIAMVGYRKTGRIPVQPNLPIFPTVTPIPTQPIRENPYFINRINTLSPVTGYSWNQDKLFYSTPKGIYDAGNNQPLLLSEIAYITWSASGTAVYQSNNQWFSFSALTEKSQLLDIKVEHPKISPDGELLASVDKTVLTILNINSGTIKNTDIKETIDNIQWSLGSNFLAINHKINAESRALIINIQGKNLVSLPIKGGGKALAVSPDEKYVALEKNNMLIIAEINEPQSTKQSFDFQKLSALTAAWIDETQIIVIETTPPNAIGRKTDNIWRIEVTGNKKLIANSNPIPQKLDINHLMITDSNKKILPLVEKRGSLWILGLIPEGLPIYSATGISFIPVSTQQD